MRLKSALKVVTAVTVCTLLLLQSNIVALVCGGQAAAFCILSIQGKRWWDKLLFLGGMGAAFITCYTLGLLVRPHALLTALSFVMVSFLAIYVRHFGEKFLLFPIFAWVMFYLAIIFPTTGLNMDYTCILGILVGCASAGLVHFLIFPQTKAVHFYHQLALFLGVSQGILESLSTSFRHQPVLAQLKRAQKNYNQQLHHRLLANQADLELFAKISSTHDTPRLHKLYVLQYRIAKALEMMLDSRQKFLSLPMTKSLEQNLQASLELVVSELRRIQKINLTQCSRAELATSTDITLDQLKTQILDCSLQNHSELTELFTFYLGLSQLHHHLRSLIHA